MLSKRKVLRRKSNKPGGIGRDLRRISRSVTNTTTFPTLLRESTARTFTCQLPMSLCCCLYLTEDSRVESDTSTCREYRTLFRRLRIVAYMSGTFFRPKRWKLLIPVLLSCRAQLTTASPAENGAHPYDVTRSIINCTTNLTACFQQALGLRNLSLERPKYRPEPLDITKLVGMSCEALLQQNLTLCPNSLSGRPSTQIEIRLAQLDQIAILITAYATVDLMEALAPHNIFAYSAKIFKELRDTHLWAVNTDPKRAPSDCYDRIAMLWLKYLEDSAYYKMNGKIAADVVNSNILFLLESWSLHALNRHIGEDRSFDSLARFLSPPFPMLKY